MSRNLLLLALTLCTFGRAYAQDAVRAGEFAQASLRQAVAEQEAWKKRIQETERLAFEKRFNELTVAVREFALQYNTHKGQVWPQDKANQLRQAMKELESMIPAPDKNAKLASRRPAP